MKKSAVKIIVILTFLVLFLTGCASKIDTNMIFNEDFSGKRIITCTVSQQKIKKDFNGGQVSLDSFIKINCPDQLQFEKTQDQINVTYKFTLDFSNKDDYIQKIEKILGYKASIVFATPQSPFSTGIILKENFTSSDLLNWFEDTAREKNLLNCDDKFFKEHTTVVNYKGETIPTENYVEIKNITSIDINKIKVDTTLKDDGSFKRQVAFDIPAKSFEENLQLITKYLTERLPESAESSFYEDNTSKIFTINFDAKDASELQLKTAKVFDSKNIVSTVDIQKNEFLSDAVIFHESLDLCSFISDTSGKVYLEYNFKSESDNKISKSEVFSSGESLISSDYQQNEGFSFWGDTSTFETTITNKYEYKIKNISINMNQNSDYSFDRELNFEFVPSNDENPGKKIHDYFESFGIKYITINSNDNSCKISFNGSIEEINLCLSKLFGENNSINLNSQYGFNLFNKSSLQDNMDFAQLIEKIGSYDGDIHYSYTSDKKIDGFLVRDYVSSDMAVKPTDTILISPKSPGTVTTSCSSLNVLFVVICILGLIFIITLISITVLYIVRSLNLRVAIQVQNGQKQILELTDEYCPNCGARVYNDMLYCNICGSFVGTIVEYEEETYK